MILTVIIFLSIILVGNQFSFAASTSIPISNPCTLNSQIVPSNGGSLGSMESQGGSIGNSNPCTPPCPQGNSISQAGKLAFNNSSRLNATNANIGKLNNRLETQTGILGNSNSNQINSNITLQTGIISSCNPQITASLGIGSQGIPLGFSSRSIP